MNHDLRKYADIIAEADDEMGNNSSYSSSTSVVVNDNMPKELNDTLEYLFYNDADYQEKSFEEIKKTVTDQLQFYKMIGNSGITKLSDQEEKAKAAAEALNIMFQEDDFGELNWNEVANELDPDAASTADTTDEIPAAPTGGTTDDDEPNDFGAEPQVDQPPADQSGPNPEDDLYADDEGDFAPGSTQPADDFDDEGEGNDLINPYGNITVDDSGALNKPNPGQPEFDQEGNVISKPNVPNRPDVFDQPVPGSSGSSGATPNRPDVFDQPVPGSSGSSGATPNRPDVFDQPVPGSSGDSVPDQTPVGGAGNISDRPSASDSQSAQPTTQTPEQPNYYPGVTEPNYRQSLAIAQEQLRRAQKKLSQGNLSNLDRLQAQNQVQIQKQKINIYKTDLIPTPRTEKGKLLHHRNMLNRSAVASGQAGDQKTRTSYKKQAAEVSQQLQKVKESKLIDLQSYINKL
jgi:hypothetical protein